MKSSCCQSTVHVSGNTTKYFVCVACQKACDLHADLFKAVNAFGNKQMTDDEALLAGIKVQNEKYAKLLAFVKKIGDYNYQDNIWDIEARELLQEIGE